MSEPEYESVEAFVDLLLSDERASFTHEEVSALAFSLQRSNHGLVVELKSWGLFLEERIPEKRVRGFQSNSHDRWYGPGASRMHGGSGWEQISGFAGQRG